MTTAELKHKKELKKELNRMLEIFVSQYKPSKIILFGSLVNNRIKKTSDIDMLIVKNTRKRYWERIDEVLNLVHPEESLDVFVLNNKEIKDNVKKNNVYLKDILNNGKVLYERAN